MPVKAVVLAAGSGTRLCPLTPFIPKELLPIEGLPAIHYVLEELCFAGVTDVLVILSEGKEVIRSYLTGTLSPKGKDALFLEEKRRRVIDSLHISFAKQEMLLGTAHAVRLAASFMGEDPMLVVFPDDLLFDARNGSVIVHPTRELIDLCRDTGDSVLLAAEIPGSEASQYGVLRLIHTAKGCFVTDIVEKPLDYTAHRAHVLIGRIMLTPRVVNCLPKHRFEDAAGIIPALLEEAAAYRLRARVYKGERYDLGSHRGYRALLKNVLNEKGRIEDNGKGTLSNMPSQDSGA